MSHQRTIERSVQCEGIGLHTGEHAVMMLRPAQANRGVIFRRTDLPGAPTIEAALENVTDTHYATTIAKNGASVKTIEHLMSALAGLGVDNVQVDLTGPEVPILDGSSAPFVELIRHAGLRRQFAPKTFLKVRQPVTVEVGTRSLRIVPSERLKVIYTMCFDHPILESRRRPWMSGGSGMRGMSPPAEPSDSCGTSICCGAWAWPRAARWRTPW